MRSQLKTRLAGRLIVFHSEAIYTHGYALDVLTSRSLRPRNAECEHHDDGRPWRKHCARGLECSQMQLRIPLASLRQIRRAVQTAKDIENVVVSIILSRGMKATPHLSGTKKWNLTALGPESYAQRSCH